jgi:hypothetical protein
MTDQDALEQFENWYSSCINNGIEPEKIVRLIGNMELVTNESVIEFLDKEGFL